MYPFSTFMTAKELASIAGQLNAMFLATDNTVHLMSQTMYAQISEQISCLSAMFVLKRAAPKSALCVFLGV